MKVACKQRGHSGLAGPEGELLEWTPESIGTATAAASTTVKTKAAESILVSVAWKQCRSIETGTVASKVVTYELHWSYPTAV